MYIKPTRPFNTGPEGLLITLVLSTIVLLDKVIYLLSLQQSDGCSKSQSLRLVSSDSLSPDEYMILKIISQVLCPLSGVM